MDSITFDADIATWTARAGVLAVWLVDGRVIVVDTLGQIVSTIQSEVGPLDRMWLLPERGHLVLMKSRDYSQMSRIPRQHRLGLRAEKEALSSVELWDIESQTLQFSLRSNAGPVDMDYSLAHGLFGEVQLDTNMVTSVCIVDMETGEILHQGETAFPSFRIVFSEGSFFVVGSGMICEYRIDSSRNVLPPVEHPFPISLWPDHQCSCFEGVDQTVTFYTRDVTAIVGPVNLQADSLVYGLILNVACGQIFGRSCDCVHGILFLSGPSGSAVVDLTAKTVQMFDTRAFFQTEYAPRTLPIASYKCVFEPVYGGWTTRVLLIADIRELPALNPWDEQ